MGIMFGVFALQIAVIELLIDQSLLICMGNQLIQLLIRITPYKADGYITNLLHTFLQFHNMIGKHLIAHIFYDHQKLIPGKAIDIAIYEYLFH